LKYCYNLRQFSKSPNKLRFVLHFNVIQQATYGNALKKCIYINIYINIIVPKLNFAQTPQTSQHFSIFVNGSAIKCNLLKGK